MNKTYMIVGGVALLAGFFLANARTATGIYANPIVGQTAANIYTAGFNFATPKPVAAA